MKHFVVSLKRVVPELDVECMQARTRMFLGDGFRKGILIMAGPTEDETGLIFVARADSQAALAEYLETSPLWETGQAELDIVEFEPERILDLMTGCAVPEGPWPAIDPDFGDGAFI